MKWKFDIFSSDYTLIVNWHKKLKITKPTYFLLNELELFHFTYSQLTHTYVHPTYFFFKEGHVILKCKSNVKNIKQMKNPKKIYKKHTYF